MFALDNKIMFVYFCCHALLGSLDLSLTGGMSFALPRKRANFKLETHLKTFWDPWMVAMKKHLYS